MARTLKLGTRRSLLAWAQSSWVARELEKKNPGLRVELVGIETRGDVIQDVSLRMIQGKEFFVAEIDEALSSRATDLSVHSMKDLSLDRPPAFTLAAMPRRENPRDALIVGPHAIARMKSGKAIRIGTSSPRRIENIPAFLENALPQPHGPIGLVEIRGNVNSRLARVLEPETSERALDGVVLALAGLVRLWADDKGRAELEKILVGCRWMILPLYECPAAPAQGALAIECRVDDADARSAIAKLHDPETARRVGRERQLLAEWGGGCHQRFGATAVDSKVLGELFFVRGAKSDGSPVEAFEWNRPGNPGVAPGDTFWNGVAHRTTGFDATNVSPPSDLAGRSVFVAHSRAVTPDWQIALKYARIWTTGSASWFRLAKLGLWVEGSSEGLGFEELEPALGEPVLRLGVARDWSVLTHAGAEKRDFGSSYGTYRIPSAEPGAPVLDELKRARFIYWGSATQYNSLFIHARPDALHACGPGRTAVRLMERGITPVIFPNAEEWTLWLGI